MARKKYSLMERKNYHSEKIKAFADKFKSDKDKALTQAEFEKYVKAVKKDKSVQYSQGFLDGSQNCPVDKQASLSERRGHIAGQKALKKSQNIKF